MLAVGGEPAGELVYRPLQNAAVPTRVLVHTGVEAAFNGRGLGSQLIAAVLADCRTRGLAVLPRCPFVKAYLGRHPEDLDVVPASERGAYAPVRRQNRPDRPNRPEPTDLSPRADGAAARTPSAR